MTEPCHHIRLDIQLLLKGGGFVTLYINIPMCWCKPLSFLFLSKHCSFKQKQKKSVQITFAFCATALY